MEYVDDLHPLLKAFWVIAIPTSFVFLIQVIMIFVRRDSPDTVLSDANSKPNGREKFQLFSLRSLIHFLLGFSWTGLLLYNIIKSSAVLILISAVAGGIFVAVLFRITSRMQHFTANTSFRIENSLNEIGTVCLTIPERKTGNGKIQISVKGSFCELDAVTEAEKIESSALVKIIKIENGTMVVVERI